MRNYRKRTSSAVIGILVRLLAYVLTSIIIPFIIKRIKKKILENQRLICPQCQRKLKVINKSEYYCKNCKTIRLDSNQ